MSEKHEEEEERERIKQERERIMSLYEGMELVEGAVQAAADLRVGVSPFPALPESLWKVVPVLIPGEGDRQGENMVRAWMGPEISEHYGTSFTPDLLAVSIATLADDDLMSFWQYVGSYRAYAASQATIVDIRVAAEKKRVLYLEAALFIFYKEGGLVHAIAKSAVRTDPSFMNADATLSRMEALSLYMKRHIEKLDALAAQCSRQVTVNVAALKAFEQGRGQRWGA